MLDITLKVAPIVISLIALIFSIISFFFRKPYEYKEIKTKRKRKEQKQQIYYYMQDYENQNCSGRENITAQDLQNALFSGKRNPLRIAEIYELLEELEEEGKVKSCRSMNNSDMANIPWIVILKEGGNKLNLPLIRKIEGVDQKK